MNIIIFIYIDVFIYIYINKYILFILLYCIVIQSIDYIVYIYLRKIYYFLLCPLKMLETMANSFAMIQLVHRMLSINTEGDQRSLENKLS